ncbi:MAG: sulfatase-like hydrolase/transferase, partial [Pseudomonadota bacterium]
DGDAISHIGVQADFITDRTADFIREDSPEPFAIFVNYVEPHFPFAGLPERLVSRYRPVAERMVPIGDYSGWSPAGTPNYTAKEQTEMMAQYLAAVTLLDEQVGRLLDTLEATGKLERTLVVYSSDHGHMTGQYGLYGKGNATRPQNLYDYSLAIPLVIAGPKELVERGQVRHEFVSLLDLFPTLLELSGSVYSGDAYDGPGRSLVSLLKGERPLASREWHFAEYGNARMISDERWKLVRYYRNAEEFDDYWYDLTHPVSERQSREPPETLRSHMVERLEAFFDSYELEHRSGRTVLDQPRHNGMEPWRDRAQSSR